MRRLVQYLAKSITANLLPDDVFRDDITLERSRELFSRYVRVVEIENHSYCNRTCWFCPNAQIDRRSKSVVMPDALFDRILDDLASIKYDQSLVWSRYHEPLADDSIYVRLKKARHRLPLAHLTMVSNGDYLNRENMRKLESSGLDRLMLDLYLPPGKERDEDVARQEVKRFATRTGLTVNHKADLFECNISGSSIDISMGLPHYTIANISTRGGLVNVPSLKNYRRTSTCFSPLHSVVVDYNGKGVLCCQTRSDAAQHERAVIGDLSSPDYTLFHFYKDLGPARLALLSPGPKKGVCQTCTMSSDGPNRLARNRLFHRVATAVPGVPQAFNLATRRSMQRRRWENGK